MKEIKAILFDAGGVLINLDIEACKTAFKQVLGYDRIDELLDPCHQKGIYGSMEEGKISTEEFRRLILAESRPGSTPEMVDACMAALLASLDEYKAGLLNELAGKYDLYILSNNNEISWARMSAMLATYGVPPQTFKGCFISSRMGMLKPDIRIYRKVVADIGLDPSQLLFIDDSMSNVEAAASVGIHSVFYKIGEDLRSLIEKELQ